MRREAGWSLYSRSLPLVAKLTSAAFYCLFTREDALALFFHLFLLFPLASVAT